MLIFLAAFLGFVASLAPLTRRIAEFNKNASLARFHFEPKTDRHFKLAGFPEVHLTDALTDDGRSALKLDFGATTRLIPVKAPPIRDLPVLAAYDEWFKALAVNEVTTNASGASIPKPGSEKLLLVARRTPDGFDPESWGSVRRSEWLFDIYTLLPDASITMSTYRWPRSDESERHLDSRNKSDSPRPWEVELEKIPRLKERSLEFQAALFVIPKLNVPQHKFNDTALSPRVLGWTLPVSMLCFLVMTFAGVFAIGPLRGDKPPQRRS